MIGLDLDQEREPAAIAVAVMELRKLGRYSVGIHYVVRHLERLSDGAPSASAAVRVAEIVTGVERQARRRPRLYVNVSGFGRSVLRPLRRKGVPMPMTPVVLVEGYQQPTRDDEEVTLGKEWLVCWLEDRSDARKLHLPTGAEAEKLKGELLEYESGDDELGSLVTALGLAVYEDYKGPLML